MKKRTLLTLATMISMVMPGAIQAQAITDPATTIVECSTRPYFTDNQCQVCQDGGELTPGATGVTIPAQELAWENILDGINQNFYETSQSIAEIKTNMGTAPTPWDENGLDWGADVVWKDLDGLNMYSLNAGESITIKTIKDATTIPLTSMKKDVTKPYLMVKIPISYYELKMGTFNESEKKTVNYCVGYMPKKVAGATPSTGTNTGTSTTPTKPTPPTTVAPNTTNTNSTTSTNTNTTANSGTTANSPATGLNDPISTDTSEVKNTSITNIDDEIPTYNAKVTLNSAGGNPADAPSRVETGPAENMFVMIAALLLSLALFPKFNKVLNRE